MTRNLVAFAFTATFSMAILVNDGLAAEDKPPLKLLNQAHPLIGKIWSPREKIFITEEQLMKAVLEGDYVLLGETHDNAKHHEDHGNMITRIAAKSQNAAIAFEMLNEDQARVVNNVEFENTDELLGILEEAKTGWEYKKYYFPVFDSVYKARLSMHPAEISRDVLMKIVTKGIDEAPEDVRAVLASTTLNDKDRESLSREIEQTHCGMINEEMTRSMMLGQQVRDAAIADALYKMKTVQVDRAILVAGSGHIRTDRGAPLYLRKLDEKSKVISVAWLEIDTETDDPQAYSIRWGSTELPFDYVVFTAQVDRPDPCEEMKKFMQHKKDHGKKT